MREAFDKTLRKVTLRYNADVLIRQLGWSLLAAGAIGAVAVLLQRVFGIDYVNQWLYVGLGAFVLLATLGLWLIHRPTKMQIALVVDERLGLRERFSTALAFEGSDDPFARAAWKEAHDAAGRVDVKGKFPVRPTRRWLGVAGTWAIAIALFLFLPAVDVFGYGQQQKAKQTAENTEEETKAEVRQTLATVESSVNKIGDPELRQELVSLQELVASDAGKDVKRQAIKKLGDLSKRLEQMDQSEQAQAEKALKDMLRNLRGDPKSLNRELGRALSQGDYSRAAKTLREMQDQMEQGRLTEEEMEKLSEYMKQLGQKLDDVARKAEQSNEKLRKEMEKEGLTPEQAKKLAEKAMKDAESIKEALKKSGLSEKQIKKLIKQAAASKQATDMAKKLAQQCKNCGSGKTNKGGMQGAEDLARQLEDLKQLSEQMKAQGEAMQDVKDAIAGIGKSKGDGEETPWTEPGKKGGQRNGQGKNKSGQGNQVANNPNSKGLGRARGERQTGDDKPVDYKSELSPSLVNDAEPVASWYIKGDQIKGEAKRDYTEVINRSEQSEAGAIKDNRIPRKYEKAMGKYFGEMRHAAEPEAATDGGDDSDQ
ncbi:MAG: hypothetical protein ACLFVU_03140 [Phycisphaerae bacterium]